MLKRTWAQVDSHTTWKPTVEEHEFIDGTIVYSFRDRYGRPSDVTKAEAEKIIKDWRMVEITEEMRKNGWIA